MEMDSININQSGQEDADSSSYNLHRSRTDVELSKKTVQFDGCRTTDGRIHYSQRTSYSDVLFGTVAHHYGHADRRDAWQNTVLRRRKEGYTPRNEEEALEEIAHAMADDKRLMTDDVDGEVRRRDALRELTKSLTKKKEIKKRLTLRTERDRRDKAKKISLFKRWKYNLSLRFHKFSESVKAQIHDYSLWHNSLKEIEGMFGTGIGSYFKFLRTLFLLNSFITLIVLSFLLIPQVICNYSDCDSDSPSGDTRSTLKHNQTLIAEKLRIDDSSEELNTMDDIVRDSRNINRHFGSQDFGAFDWLTGSGWMNYSEAFYGAYSTGVILNDDYNMTLCYFFTISTCFVIYLGFLVRKVVKVYKQNYIDTENEIGSSLVKIVFCGWDFNITDEKGSYLQHRRIYIELYELLEKCREEEVIDGFWSKCKNFIPKMLAWIIMIGLLVGMYLLAQFIQENVIENGIKEDNYYLQSLLVLIYPVMANLLLYFMPIVLEYFVVLECYKKIRNAIYTTLTRIMMIELVILGVLISSWFTKEENEDEPCWENSLGQEIYRLLIVDFIFFFVTSGVFSIALYIFNKRMDGSNILDKINKFNVARNTFHLIYNQTLLWAGFFFCPLTCVMVTIKLIFIFYTQKIIALKILRPEDRPWRAAQMETSFLFLTLVSLILAVISYCYIIFNGHSSDLCGPFTSSNSTTYIALINEKIGDDKLVEIVKFILKPGMVTLFLGILAIGVYCIKSVADGRAEMVVTLRRQLDMETRDRTFLIELIERLQTGARTKDGHLIPSPRSPAERRRDKETRQLTRRSSSFFTPSKVHPERQISQYSGDLSEYGISLENQQ